MNNLFSPPRYLHNHLTNLFAGAWEVRDLSPLPVHVPKATDEEVSFNSYNYRDSNVWIHYFSTMLYLCMNFGVISERVFGEHILQPEHVKCVL